MARLNKTREEALQPQRVQVTKQELEALGYRVTQLSDDALQFTHKGYTVIFYPYSGWHTGKTIKDGRGFKKLIKQLKPETVTLPTIKHGSIKTHVTHVAQCPECKCPIELKEVPKSFQKIFCIGCSTRILITE